MDAKALKLAAAMVVAGALFVSGYAAGQNRFGEPKTIIHVVTIKWKPGVPDEEKRKVLEGVKTMAAKIPGIQNIWLKPERIQPRDFNAAFVIEFQDRAAADRYAEDPVHKAWAQHYLPLRAESRSVQVTNP